MMMTLTTQMLNDQTKPKGFKIPPSISQLKDAKVWKKLWYRMHVKRKMCFIVIVGRPGSGKSVLGIEIASRLDIGSKKDVSRFKPDHFTLGPLQLLEKIKSRFPYGTFLLNDDAGLTADSREAMSTINRTLSKVLQSCREDKHLGIILTLPFFDMLDKNLRSLADVVIVVKDWDANTKITKFKFYWVDRHPLYGKTYYKRPKRTVKTKHPDGALIVTKNPIDEMRIKVKYWDVIEECRKRKLAYLDNEYADFYREMLSKVKKKTFNENFEIACKRIDRYTFTDAEGKLDIDSTLILTDPELGVRAQADAARIAKTLRRRLDAGQKV